MGCEVDVIWVNSINITQLKSHWFILIHKPSKDEEGRVLGGRLEHRIRSTPRTPGSREVERRDVSSHDFTHAPSTHSFVRDDVVLGGVLLDPVSGARRVRDGREQKSHRCETDDVCART